MQCRRTFTFGAGSAAVTVTIPKAPFNLGPYKGSTTICQTIFLDLGLFNDKDDKFDTWLVGAPLLKNYYTVWDAYRVEISFATPVFS